MTNEIPRNEWKQFFDELSRDFLDWETKIEVVKDDIGAQVLNDDLLFAGITFEESRDGQSRIEIMTGESTDSHQSHNILNPQKVFYLKSEKNLGGTLEIEDDSSAKTLIYFIQPVPVLVGYAECQVVAGV